VDLSIAVHGPASDYSFVIPESVVTRPGTEAVVRVGFHLPRAPVPHAGPLSFEIVVRTKHEAHVVATAAGALDVQPYTILSATLVPPTGTGRHELTLSNRGNAPTMVGLRPNTSNGALDVRVAPDEVVVPPDGQAKAVVDVTGKRPVVGHPRTLRFGVTVDAGSAAPAIAVEGDAVQTPRLAPRPALATALIAVLALVGGVLVLTAGGSSDDSDGTVVGAAGAKLDACPATGHVDAFGIRGLQPDEIAKLPNAYTFTRVKADGCNPVRFNPCEPVHYVQNSAAAPPGVVADVQESFRRLSRATGITFVDEGETDETTRTGPYLPERYGSRWAPIVILWEHFPQEQTTGERQVLGQTTVFREQEVVVSARLRFNVDAYNDESTRTPIQAGWGPPLGTGTGPIGRYNITWGRIILHELAHVVGLGHTRDPSSLMYPDAAQHTGRPADFTPPDLLGLRYLGREAGCVPTPPLPAG
jgi:hypothetical protein